MFDTNKIKAMFPIFEKHRDLIYLDSAASSLKPQSVIDKMNEYNTDYGVNVHRGVYELSYKATDEYDIAREKIARFINAKTEEIVFTRNTTESLNMVALMNEHTISEKDVIITSELEHHSSLLPWMKLCERKNAELRYIPLDSDGRITVKNFKKVLDNNVKFVALNYVSNVMGYITPIKEIIQLAHEKGAIVIIDAAQAVNHFRIDVKDLDCDYLAFSGHKMYGPTGIGILYGKRKLLQELDPIYYGGDMNENVYHNRIEIKDIPYRFESGTPMIQEAIGLGAAVDFINKLGINKIDEHIKELHKYAVEKFSKLEGVTLYNPKADIGILNFNINGVHPHDAATNFDEENICIRAGYHCAQLVSKWLKCNGTLRASISIYNSIEDIDKFIEAIKGTVEFFKKFEGNENE